MWIHRFIRALGVGFRTFAKRRPALTLVVLIFGPVVALNFALRWTERPEQIEAREAAEARQSAEQAAAQETKRRLCEVKSICERYGQARQDCAPAADFDRCIRIKMGEEGYGVLDACTDGGHLKAQSQPPEPGAVECWFNRR